MSILEVHNIEKHFGATRVLEDISFSLEEGQAQRCADELGQQAAKLHGQAQHRTHHDAGVGGDQLHQLAGLLIPEGSIFPGQHRAEEPQPGGVMHFIGNGLSLLGAGAVSRKTKSVCISFLCCERDCRYQKCNSRRSHRTDRT